MPLLQLQQSSPSASSTSASSLLKEEEKGHRLGNFHNYYTFNPTSNRISILHNLNIIDYLYNQFIIMEDGKDDEVLVGNGDDYGGNDNVSMVSSTNSNSSSDANEMKGENERKAKRLKLVEEKHKVTTYSTTKQHRIITYCDLGCNEGDLTISLSKNILNYKHECNGDIGEDGQEEEDDDNDATIIMKNDHDQKVCVHCLGLDIDPILIKRANWKYQNKQKDDNVDIGIDSIHHNNESNPSAAVHATFETCNIGNNDEFVHKCQSYLSSQPRNTTRSTPTTTTTFTNTTRFDLISIFSTTMWIHIHHGDDGLQQLLQSICSLCNYLIIEPQPSKCYRSVNVRLRKMGVDEVDVSLDRLKMRKDIEGDIDKVILGCGFERVMMHVNDDDADEDVGVVDLKKNLVEKSNNDKDRDMDRTTWNRTLRLYKRREVA